MPKLCVTVTADRLADLRRRRDEVRDADLVELRLDTVRDPDVGGALAGRKLPVIVTCRPVWEGGHFTGSEEERQRILSEAIALGAEFVDVEWRAGFTDLLTSTGGRRIVLSNHEFSGVPSDLADRLASMRSTGAEIVKIAVMARSLTDNLALLAVAGPRCLSTVLLAMGEAGLPSRVLAGRFGSCWTYAGDAVAPGQIPQSRLVREFGFRRLTLQTALYGVVGRPIAHSLSPAMHNAAFKTAHLDAVYLPLAADSADDFFAFASAMDLRGVSVTAPFKLDAFERADESDAVSRRIGSVNTLKREGNRWIACNTDVAGFLGPLQPLITVAGTRATILGGGGAARAVALALASAGAHVTVTARNRPQAESVAQIAGVGAADWPPRSGSWDLLVNATPVGTAPHSDVSPLPDEPFLGHLVYDLVYNPPVTRLLADAAKAGCQTLSGLDMLIAQAERQFEWWTGERGFDRVMRQAALDRLAELSEQAASPKPQAPSL
jgi:3-dehydroquinate dehydratase/shikimate dehydrogenase